MTDTCRRCSCGRVLVGLLSCGAFCRGLAMRQAEDTLGHFECISKILSSQAIFDRVQLSLCNISSLPLFFKGTRLSLLTFYTHHLSTELSAVGAKRDVENIPILSFGLTIHPRPCRTFNNKLTRPSKQCKSLIDVLILRQHHMGREHASSEKKMFHGKIFDFRAQKCI